MKIKVQIDSAFQEETLQIQAGLYPVFPALYDTVYRKSITGI